MRLPHPSSLVAIAVVAVLLLATSCTEPVVTVPSHIRSIAIPVFANRTSRAGLELDVTQRVLHEFMSSSELGVTPNPEEADAVLHGEIYDYQRTPISWDQTNRIVQYKIRIMARIWFEDRTTKTIIWKNDDVDGVTTYSILASPPETEEPAIFKAADELARDIFFLVFEERQYTDDDLVMTNSQTRPGEVSTSSQR